MAKGMHHPLESVVEYVAEIPIGPTVRVYRIRTPGGWIVTSGLVDVRGMLVASALAMVYVPDDEHAWQIGGRHDGL